MSEIFLNSGRGWPCEIFLKELSPQDESRVGLDSGQKGEEAGYIEKFYLTTPKITNLIIKKCFDFSGSALEIKEKFYLNGNSPSRIF